MERQGQDACHPGDPLRGGGQGRTRGGGRHLGAFGEGRPEQRAVSTRARRPRTRAYHDALQVGDTAGGALEGLHGRPDLVLAGMAVRRQTCRRPPPCASISRVSAVLAPPATVATTRAGLRFGDKGTHTSRTMMLAELGQLLTALPASASSDRYAEAVVEENALGKHTDATRRLSLQRLTELYGLDPVLPLFRALRRVWAIDEDGRPLTALLCALARDPLLRATAPVVIPLAEGAELVRATLLDALRAAVGDRLNDAVLDKVARNAASTWSQSGHLEGRVRKVRQRVTPTAGSLALALWLASLEGLAGAQLLASGWAEVLDRSPRELEPFVLRAKQLGLVSANIGGGTVEIDPSGLGAPDGTR